MILRIRLLLILLGLLSLSACINWVPYKRPDIQQGNIITQAQVSELKKGMSKTQVIEVLGSPVVQNGFNENELVYIETKQINGGKIKQNRLILSFKQDQLVAGTGDYKLPF